MKKLLLIILDGLGDLPNKEIGNKTALEFAKTPNMDNLALEGRCGLMYVLGKGISPESDAAMYAIMGQDPFKDYPGRAAFEALGLGIKVRKGELVMRGNLATVDKQGRILDVRAGRIGGYEAEKLINELDKIELSDGSEVLVRKEEGYRLIVVFRSDIELSDNITNTHPGYIKPGTEFGVAQPYELGKTKVPKCKPFDNNEGTIRAAKLVNEFTEKAHKVLESHPINAEREVPANYVILRDAASDMPDVEDITKKYGLRWGAVTERIVEKGLCSHIGMDIMDVPAEKDLKQDCKVKVKAALKDIDFYDCMYIYIKGPDNPSHDGNVKEKVRVIEVIDTYLIGPLVDGLDMNDTAICITADHSTPCAVRVHTPDPVPILLYGLGKGSCKVFSERECAKGDVGTIHGTNLIPLLMKSLKSG